MAPVTIARTALLAALLATFAVASDKPPHIYQKGTIKGWENRIDMWGAGFVGPEAEGIPLKVTVFELKGMNLVYMIDYCGAFQAGQFGPRAGGGLPSGRGEALHTPRQWQRIQMQNRGAKGPGGR